MTNPSSPLTGAHVLLAVTGSIAAYKAAALASALVQAGASVQAILTAGAQQFVLPLTFTALTQRPALTEPAAAWNDAADHVSIGAAADLLLVAPASANAIARLALGLADDLLGAVALSTSTPLLVAPAMEHGMLHHPATQAHLATLRGRGAHIVGPETGHLASGAVGDGRLVPVETLVGATRWLLGRTGDLAGRTVVVTAGGTHEPLDPVRFLGNRSSGAMGFALAQAALDRGAEVRLVTGPTNLDPPYAAAVTRVETAAEMLAAVRAATATADALVMAAAVADYRPASPSPSKIKKRSAGDQRSLELVENVDILAAVDRPNLVRIGFAAETDHLERHAVEKRRAKGLALLVANDAVATIGSDHSTALLVDADGAVERLPMLAKTDLAAIIIERLGALLPPPRPAKDR